MSDSSSPISPPVSPPISPPTSLATWARTLVHLRPAQIPAHLRHALLGGVTPVAHDGPVPSLFHSPPSVPFLPPPAHADIRFSGNGPTVELVNRRVSFASAIGWEHTGEGSLFAYQLHDHNYLRVDGLPPSQRAAVMLDWIERHSAGIGWDPHPISLRTLSWGKLLLTPGALELDPECDLRVRGSLAGQVETLARNLEVRLQVNHLFTNLIAVVFGGLLFEGRDADRWLAQVPALQRELSTQVLPDGLHEERSPMYQALLLEEVLDLLNLARAASARAPGGLVALLEQTAARMLGALQVLTHPDGEIALFADSAHRMASGPAELAQYAQLLGVGPQAPERKGWLRESGYFALKSAGFHLIASVAGPAPVHNPGHAHCDALSFELSLGKERVVSDTGVAEYVPGTLRDLCRATASHATLQVDGQEQAECWGSHRIGGRPRVVTVRCEPGASLEATCTGWSTRDTLHRRCFEAVADGIEIHDSLEGRARPVRLTLPLERGAAAKLVPGRSGGDAVEIQLPQAAVRVDLPGGDPDKGVLDWRLERSPCFPEFGRVEERWCLVGEGEKFRSGTWHIQRAGR